jgi:hypothetical protein
MPQSSCSDQNLDPLQESLSNYSKTLTIQTSALKGQDVSSIGFQHGVRDRFPSSTPKLEIEASLEIPDRMTSGSEFNFRASFRVLSMSKNVAHIPAITFTILRLDLKEITHTRAPCDTAASTSPVGYYYKNRSNNIRAPDAPYSGREHHDKCERKTHLNSLPESAKLELEEVPGEGAIGQVSSCEAWFSAQVPGFIPPSFRSFAISKTYRVKVKLGIEIGGRSLNMKWGVTFGGWGVLRLRFLNLGRTDE